MFNILVYFMVIISSMFLFNTQFNFQIMRELLLLVFYYYSIIILRQSKKQDPLKFTNSH